jgi:hypothetical protein
MRWALCIGMVLLLTRCANMGVSDYSADSGSRSSLLGNQGGAGVQAPIWSTDSNKSTVTNQNASQ